MPSLPFTRACLLFCNMQTIALASALLAKCSKQGNCRNLDNIRSLDGLTAPLPPADFGKNLPSENNSGTNCMAVESPFILQAQAGQELRAPQPIGR